MALNAKFLHSSLALRNIIAYSNRNDIILQEFTINTNPGLISREIYSQKPDIIGFSCYIWNIDYINSLCADIKKVLPDTIIVLGGPEVSYETSLSGLNANIIVMGEGESTFAELLSALEQGQSLSSVKGLMYESQGITIITEKRELLALDLIPFSYTDLQGLEDRILYYESSRGCPFNCQYCLSSTEKEVRFLSKKRILRDLDFFLKAKPRQVKFVDRTFNCRKCHALFIWSYLIENDNNYTNFHFEISADLMDKELLHLLKSARPGLFQFEIGIQSTNAATLSAISRKTDLNKLFSYVKEIRSFGNIHLHLDLIAGLPAEGINSFRQSFNDVYLLNPHMLQLGFLKLLKGSGLREDTTKYGIVYSEKPPYQVLYTADLNYSQLLQLQMIEDVFQIYYNSGRHNHTLTYAVDFWETPFDFYCCLADYWEKKSYHLSSHSKMEMYYILYSFLLGNDLNMIFVKDLLKFDMYLNENVKNLPSWLNKLDWKNTKKIPCTRHTKITHIEGFSHDILAWAKNGTIIQKDTYIFFDYRERGQVKYEYQTED